MSRNPLQPIIVDDDKIARFKRNKIVEFLLDHGGFDMNKLAVMDFTQDDREQFAQLIGYSVSGFHELSYVSDETALHASIEAKKVTGDWTGCRFDSKLELSCSIHYGVERE